MAESREVAMSRLERRQRHRDYEDTTRSSANVRLPRGEFVLGGTSPPPSSPLWQSVQFWLRFGLRAGPATSGRRG